MITQDLSRFYDLIQRHLFESKSLFNHIEHAAVNGTLSSDSYRILLTNIAVRTMLSLPEIHACCIQASLDLDPLRTSYSVLTGAEEGGAGDPDHVHSVLMMNAINYHGQIVFELEPIDLKYFMGLIRLLYSLEKYLSLLYMESCFQGISRQIEKSGFVDISEIKDTCSRMAGLCGVEIPISIWHSIEELEMMIQTVRKKLTSLHVLEETVAYCLAQMQLLGNMKAGYLPGVGFAHEALADGMIQKMFKVFYASINQYNSTSEFMEKVYPYFAAHGNYIEVETGLSEVTAGVEVIHAERELEKLRQLDDQALEEAWIGANDFANRNSKIWEGLNRTFKFLPD